MYRRDYSEGAAFFFEVLIGMVLIAIMAGIVGLLFQACHPEKPRYYVVMGDELLRPDGSGETEKWVNINSQYGALVVVDHERVYEIPTLAEWINRQKGEG